MALPLYRVTFSQISFSVYKPKQNLPQMIKRNNGRYPLIRCADNYQQTSHAYSGVALYQPTNWSFSYIQNLDTYFTINFKEKVKELEKQVMPLNVDYENGRLTTLRLLEHIDDIERLGLGYRFQNDIGRALDIIASINQTNFGDEEKEVSLHAESLRFRLLRKHGYNVSQDFLKNFKESHGGFKGILEKDVKGLLSLYEASYLSFEWEKDLQEAKRFATEHLFKLQSQGKEAIEDIKHALELPLYRRTLKLEARWYIDAYRKRKDANLLLLELAILDFNMVQSAFKQELQEVSKWWNAIGLPSKLGLVRDRLMECFFFTVGMVFEPQYYQCRVVLTKVCTLITIMDDTYDLYDSLDELNIFTDAVKRWDTNAIKHMPEYFRLCFRPLYNAIIEMCSNTSIVQGEDIIPTLILVWGELFEAFFVEAKWTHNKYIPTLQDYLDNAWKSASGVVILTHAYFLISKDIKKDADESLEKHHDLLRWSSTVFRLCNDLVASSNEIESGKTVNAVSCYMHENGVCEEVACKYIETLIDEAWMELIKTRVTCSQESTYPFIDMAINLARISHCIYQFGDGVGAPNDRARDQVLSVIIDPVPK